MPAFLETDRLVLRGFTDADADHGARGSADVRGASATARYVGEADQEAHAEAFTVTDAYPDAFPDNASSPAARNAAASGPCNTSSNRVAIA